VYTKIDLFKHSNVKTVSFQAGEIIFAENEPGNTLFVIQSGQVEILMRHRVVEVLESGSLFGEMALVTELRRVATASAYSDCTLISIDYKQFQSLIATAPEFAISIMQVLSERLFMADQQLMLLYSIP